MYNFYRLYTTPTEVEFTETAKLVLVVVVSCCILKLLILLFDFSSVHLESLTVNFTFFQPTWCLCNKWKYRNDPKFLTDRFRQTVQHQIRLLLGEQSDQGLHCLLFHLHLYDEIH